jgi:putative transposase
MRLKREEFAPDQYYHLYNHAISGQMLFRDRIDYENAMGLMLKYSCKSDFSMVAYCLMPNHYHVLLYQKTDVPAYTFIYKWSYAYSRYYNARHGTTGTIFSNKLQSIGITEERYLLRLCAYIHLNPIKAELVTELSDWEWSSYPEWIEQRENGLYDSYIRNSYFTDAENYRDFILALKPDPDDKKLMIDA